MKKIMIIGPGNAGKSTLALKLGKKLHLPVYHLDQYFWLSDWQPKDRERWVSEHLALVNKPEWIIEGDFGGLYDIRAQHADTILFLDIPKRVLIIRSFIRRIKYFGKTRPDITEGNIEKFDKEYYGYLKWLVTYDRSKPLGIINKYKEEKSTFILKSKKDVKQFLRSSLSQ